MSEVLDFNMNFETNQQSDADKSLVVLFYREPIKNEIKSIDAGRPIFDEIDLVKIITPGSRDTFVGDATYEYQQRFPTQWARYKQGRDQSAGSGTPLNQLPWLSISQIAEFNAVGCYTIEQLVGMADSLSQKFMGHHAIKQKALAYIDAAKNAAPMLKLQSELEKRDAQIKELQEQMAAILAQKAADNAAKVTPKA